MKILGIHDGHNAAAALLVDGRVVAAVQEERLTRVKNWFGFPEGSIRKVLELGGCRIEDLDAAVFNGHHMPYPKTREEILREYGETGSLKTTLKRALKGIGLRTLHTERRKRERLAAAVALGLPKEKVEFVDHHTCHAAAAYYGQANLEDPVLVLTNDGAGDGLCATVSVGRNGKLDRRAAVPEADSIGNLYAMTTFLMGMVPLEHEYKLMGLAPYAPEKGRDAVSADLRRLMSFPSDPPCIWKRNPGCPATYYSYEFLTDLFRLKRFDWIAAGLQDFTERMLTEWVTRCIRKTGVRKVALSGGVFMNVKANQLILALDDVESLFVFPSCGDETNALGAAWWKHAQESLKRGDGPGTHPIAAFTLGSEFSPEQIGRAVEAFLAEEKGKRSYTVTQPDDLEDAVAALLEKGEVVARFAGRAEFGARALGNRSILANPSLPDVVRTINEMIKSRDFWMPFAPSILSERMNDYVLNPKRVPGPYMILCYNTTDRRNEIKSALHPYDGTARPQEVIADWNPRYHRLISAFEKRTGIGAVLNTSFNLHGYPIVETPKDALEVLRDSGLRWLSLGPLLVAKS